MALLLFLFGLCVGSFINCMVYRLNLPASLVSQPCQGKTPPRKNPAKEKPRQGKTLRVEDPKPEGLGNWRGLLSGRSYCDHCKRTLAWSDLIPLLSFVLLKGKCRYCHSPISWQYPAVEIGTGVATLLVFFHLAGVEVVASPPPRWPTVAFYLLITYALIAIFVSDLKYQIIPDQVIYPAIVATLIYNFIFHFSFFIFHLAASLMIVLFFAFLIIITRGHGMGWGDVKLAALMGLLLGWPKIIIALYFAFLTGALVGVILILTGKKKFGQHIPFGPFLVMGTFVSWFFGERILEYLEHLGYFL